MNTRWSDADSSREQWEPRAWKALGVVYEDDEELMGGEEITERDEHRWELDPASKDDDDEF